MKITATAHRAVAVITYILPKANYHSAKRIIIRAWRDYHSAFGRFSFVRLLVKTQPTARMMMKTGDSTAPHPFSAGSVISSVALTVSAASFSSSVSGREV
jgi:hypothetical protein